MTVPFAKAFAQEESPSASETRPRDDLDINTSQAQKTKPTPAASEAANGSVEVEVKVKEYTIEMPISAWAGPTTFKVTNTGKETHGFEIEGNGIENQIKPRLREGESGSLRVELKPGTYQVYCPVKGHKMLGMSLELTVK